MAFLPNPAQARNKPVTVPSPTGGLNASASLADMPPTDAVSMRNWWPQPYGLSVRKGTREWALGLGGPVNTIATWNSISGSGKAFAWALGWMYDISTRQRVNAPLLAGLSNSWWQTTQLVNAAGAHMLAVNGADNGIVYNETGIHRLTVGDGIAAYTWKNLDPKAAVELTVHQGRLWAVKQQSSEAWYLPVGQISGVLVKFDFGPLFSRGGYLAQLTTWTIDDGNGAEDHLVAVSSRGEAVVYGGTNPADDAKWTLVGVYYVGPPLPGRRSWAKISGDLVFLTQRGLVSTAAMLVSTKVKDSNLMKSSKIQFLLAEATTTFGTLDGWSFNYFPPINMLMVNIPVPTGTGPVQLASNDVMPEQPWTTFHEVPAICWKAYSEFILFGNADGNVMEFWTGYTDNKGLAGLGGDAIASSVQQAYTYLGGMAVQKQVDMYRINFITDTPYAVSYASNLLYDFTIPPVRSINAAVAPRSNRAGINPLGTVAEARWGIGQWDEDLWGGSSQIQANYWKQAIGLGYVVSLAISMKSSTSVIWVSTDMSSKQGGLL